MAVGGACPGGSKALSTRVFFFWGGGTTEERLQIKREILAAMRVERL